MFAKAAVRKRHYFVIVMWVVAVIKKAQPKCMSRVEVRARLVVKSRLMHEGKRAESSLIEACGYQFLQCVKQTPEIREPAIETVEWHWL
jgi:hypothetical protein